MSSDISTIPNQPVSTNKGYNINLNVKETLDKFLNKSSIIIGLIVVIFVSIMAAYGLYVYIGTSIFKQNKIIIDGTKTPILCNTLSKIPITTYAESGNGKRRSYTFWIYINDLNKYQDLYKHVFHIGAMDNALAAFPYVFLDKTENKLHIRFSSKTANYSTTFGNGLKDVENLTDDQRINFMENGITIDYIPIQRWVHIAVVINENSNGGTIMSYVDAEYTKVVTTNDLINGKTIKIKDFDMDLKGDLYVGGSEENYCGFSGLLSKVTIYNYDINDKDIYDDYNTGPLNGFMARYVGAYGIRSPIYKIN
jgi:hypothetical protein